MVGNTLLLELLRKSERGDLNSGKAEYLLETDYDCT